MKRLYDDSEPDDLKSQQHYAMARRATAQAHAATASDQSQLQTLTCTACAFPLPRDCFMNRDPLPAKVPQDAQIRTCVKCGAQELAFCFTNQTSLAWPCVDCFLAIYDRASGTSHIAMEMTQELLGRHYARSDILDILCRGCTACWKAELIQECPDRLGYANRDCGEWKGNTLRYSHVSHSWLGCQHSTDHGQAYDMRPLVQIASAASTLGDDPVVRVHRRSPRLWRQRLQNYSEHLRGWLA